MDSFWPFGTGGTRPRAVERDQASKALERDHASERVAYDLWGRNPLRAVSGSPRQLSSS
jgi:hypothetical protein